MVAIIGRPQVSIDISDWPTVDTDWMDDDSGWEEPCGPPNPKLSELIRCGARYRRQIRSLLYDPHTGDVCALGAAYVGAFGTMDEGTNTSGAQMKLYRVFGLPMFTDVAHDVSEHNQLAQYVVDMNDQSRLSFGEIATKLEGIGQ